MENVKNVMKNQFDYILEQEGLLDWTWEISKAGNLCWHSRKHIDTSESLAMFLHEVAHALISPTEKDKTGHDSIWADKYTSLIEKYMSPFPYLNKREN